MKKMNYVSPMVEAINVNIEKGVAASTGAVENTYAPEGEAGMLEEGETYEF